MYENVLKRIINASQNNSLSFFVGAGVSALSDAPTWTELINAICNELGYGKKETYSSDDFLRIPQMYFYSLGKDQKKYSSFIKNSLYSKNLSPNCIHNAMLSLHPVSFITTNYDTLIEEAASQRCQSFKVISHDKDVPTIFGDRYILKLHGDFKYNNFVLKEEDYLNYSENFKLIETLMKSLFSTNTVVFIGYSLNDYNIKLILNWTKSLLKDNFNKPIFIHSGKNTLSEFDILYHESKGLIVIDTNKLEPSSDYLKKYESVFNEIKRVSKSSLDGKTEEDAFGMLYDFLNPLNKLNALRIFDISDKLSSYVYVDEIGVIHIKSNGLLLFRHFVYIHNLTDLDRKALSKEKIKKYICILDVLIKARICEMDYNKTRIKLTSSPIPFADKNCISFNYLAMYEYTEKKYKSISENYKKAFYLSRLSRYDESLSLYNEIAKMTFEAKNYIIYYLSTANCIFLNSAIKNMNFYYGGYNLDKIVSMAPSKSEIERIFYDLPAEYRNEYNSFNDIHTPNILYKYSYESYNDIQKLQYSIDNNTTEFGITSTQKVISRKNGYLHFLQGNGIIIDIFTEYKFSVRNLMSLLLYKYSSQDKQSLIPSPFPINRFDTIQFNHIDFYCFVEYFSDKELLYVFRKYQIESVTFQNMEMIENAVNNLFNGYELLVKKYKSGNAVNNIELRIRCCLALLRFVNISQRLVDQITIFILKHTFREITIDDKIFFLDSQLGKRKMISETTAKAVEDTLIDYLDKHITAALNDSEFDVLSKTTGINYYNLVNYISLPENSFISRRLNKQIKRIIDNRLRCFYSSIANYFCPFLSSTQKKSIVTWANKEIAINENMDLFVILIQCDARISSIAKKQLKHILYQELDSAAENKMKTITSFPIKPPYEKLEMVGYWCFIGILQIKDFKEFNGNSALFDFYCQYNKFDFSKFDVSWLMNLNKYALNKVASDTLVREKIRIAIASEIIHGNIKENDKKRLHSILVNYFC